MTSNPGAVPAFSPRPTTARLVGCYTWASDLHTSIGQLSAELKDLGQQQAAKRLVIAQKQLQQVCRDLEHQIDSHVMTHPT